MKSSRKDLDRQTAVPPPYDSFFSFPKAKGGYSGVAVYYYPSCAVASKAEEGLSGTIQPKPPLSPDECISRIYPSASGLPLLGLTKIEEDGVMETAVSPPPTDLIALDGEGRALVLDFGLFVLINVYCPMGASDERDVFKMNFHLMLEARVRTLIEEGREVIVAGDLNIAANPIDHVEHASLSESRQSTYWDPAPRAWLKTWLAPNGPLTDVIRRSWPDRKGMYTCKHLGTHLRPVILRLNFFFYFSFFIGWNTKIQARDNNYGTRIDYILVTRGLLPWVKGGDIQASIRGSDHCPVYIDLHDQITLENGDTLYLKNLLGGLAGSGSTSQTTSRLAAKYWDEYSGKQTLLSNFFGKDGAPKAKSTTPPTPPSSDTPISSTVSELPRLDDEIKPSFLTMPSDEPNFPPPDQDPPPTPFISFINPAAGSTSTSHPLPYKSSPPPVSEYTPESSKIIPSKRKSSSSVPKSLKAASKSENPISSSSKKKRLETGQAKLSSFFAQTAVSSSSRSRRSASSQGKSSSSSKTKQSKDPTLRTERPSSLSSLSSSQPTYHTLSDCGSDSESTPIVNESNSTSPPASSAAITGNVDVDNANVESGVSPSQTPIDLEADYAFALSLSQAPSTSSSQGARTASSSSSSSWAKMLTPVRAPLCTAHGEPTKEYKVNKSGPNKGKMFFLCSRQVVLSHSILFIVIR